MAASTDNEEDSEMASSSSETSTSSWSSEAGDSPRPAAASPASPATRRVPPLSLRADLAALSRGDAAPDTPGTARQLGVPAAVPAGLPPGPAPRQAPSLVHVPPLTLAVPASHPQLQPSCQAAALLSLDILSPAFSLREQQQAAGGSDCDQLALSCAGRLGVPLERLRFFALTQVAGLQELPPGCSRVALEVLDSRFSLSALEELVAENQRLAVAGQSIRGQQQQPSEIHQLEALMQKLQLENSMLHQQLDRSEALRRKGAQALQELQQEFTSLSCELLRGTALGLSHPQLDCKVENVVGTPAAVQDGLLQNGS